MMMRLQQGSASSEMGFSDRVCTAAILSDRCLSWVNIYRNPASAEGPFIGALPTSKAASCAIESCQKLPPHPLQAICELIYL